MNRPEASDGFAADIRCELLIMIPLRARRIGVICRVFWSYVKSAQAGIADAWFASQSRRNDLNW